MIEPGQLRRWIDSDKQDLFVILEYDPEFGGGWWILDLDGRCWEPKYEVEDFSEVIDEAG